MGPLDYDERLHAGYVQGAALPPEALASWLSAFGRWLPPERSLRLADVGSGAGRFTSALADAFGGPVVGIEPSAKMRSLALASSPHPKVCYLGGRCEALPLAPDTVDGALLFGVWHHLTDRSAGANELARVVRPTGQLLLRTSASDRLAPPWWNPWFPEVHALDLALLPSLAETMATMESAGWELEAIDEVSVPSGLTRKEDLERLRHRALSTLEYLDDAVVEAGLHRITAAMAEDPRADDQLPATLQELLVFSRP